MWFKRRKLMQEINDQMKDIKADLCTIYVAVDDLRDFAIRIYEHMEKRDNEKMQAIKHSIKRNEKNKVAKRK